MVERTASAYVVMFVTCRDICPKTSFRTLKILTQILSSPVDDLKYNSLTRNKNEQ